MRRVLSKLLILAFALQRTRPGWGQWARRAPLIFSPFPKCTQLPWELGFRLMQIVQTIGKNSSGQLSPWNVPGRYIIAIVLCYFNWSVQVMLESLTKKRLKANFLSGSHKAEEQEKHHLYQAFSIQNPLVQSTWRVLPGGWMGWGTGAETMLGVQGEEEGTKPCHPRFGKGIHLSFLSLEVNW